MVTRLPPKEKTAGSSPVRDGIDFFNFFLFNVSPLIIINRGRGLLLIKEIKKKKGREREGRQVVSRHAVA